MERKRINIAALAEDKGPYEIETSVQDGAYVASGKVTLSFSEGIKDTVAALLEEKAALIRNEGGIIGHLKAACVEQSSTAVSVTKDKAHVSDTEAKSMQVMCTFIVFNTGISRLRELLEEFFDQLKTRQD